MILSQLTRKYWPNGYWTNSLNILTLDKMENLNCPIKMKEMKNLPMKKTSGSNIPNSDFYQILKEEIMLIGHNSCRE